MSPYCLKFKGKAENSKITIGRIKNKWLLFKTKSNIGGTKTLRFLKERDVKIVAKLIKTQDFFIYNSDFS